MYGELDSLAEVV